MLQTTNQMIFHDEDEDKDAAATETHRPWHPQSAAAFLCLEDTHPSQKKHAHAWHPHIQSCIWLVV